MKYDGKKFNSAVKEYRSILGNIKGKSFFVVFDMSNRKAFFSIAPLSRAVHELGADMNAMGIKGKSETLDAMEDVWEAYEQQKKGIKNKKTKAFSEYIKLASKKAGKDFEKIFEKPDYAVKAGKTGFNGNFKLPFMDSWFKIHRENELKSTCRKIWNDVFNIKKYEKTSVGFVLVQKDEMLGHPLEDYLDSYAICWHMMLAKRDNIASMSSYTQRKSMLGKSERISEMKATLLGCELCRESKEGIFRTFKKLSTLLKLSRIKAVDAAFSIAGKGYPGKHVFGEAIGYPSLNKKTRWQSPGQMVYKLDYFPQTALDERDPMSRVGFTETLPLDVFIETCNIDWKKMRDRNWKIKEIMDKCNVIKVKGKKINGYRTDFEVGLVKKDGTRRWVRTSDTDVREKINSEYLRMTGIKAGTMANLPGGEAFVTPEYLKGTFAGDVVISIDQSYLLPEKNPLVVESDGNTYKIVSGPEKIIKKLGEKKRESWEVIMNQEKFRSLPKEIIEIKKDNFERIGEFAINTNPSAKLCNYLIVNEKIAKMIHVALGSGFEPDRATEYHTDIVINSPRQKMDIYGVDKEGKKYWIIKKGEFVI
jgi:hypothetical protein